MGEVGKQLKKARHIAGLTQKQLGELLGGVGISTISEWESGKRSPDVELLPILSRVLHVSQGFILGLTDDPNYIKKDNNEIIAVDSKDIEIMLLFRNAKEWQKEAVRKILGVKDETEL